MPKGRPKGKGKRKGKKSKLSKPEQGAAALARNIKRIVRDLQSLTKVEIIIHVDSTK
jgi:ribosomal protein L19E